MSGQRSGRPSEEHAVHPEVLRYLEGCRQALGLDPGRMRVLDWGCGRGQSVAWLRARGYDARGADIDPQAVNEGRQAMPFKPHDDDDPLALINTGGRTPFPDGSFHFVFSNQVYEHVADVDATAREIWRVTAPGGSGLHIFPAHRNPMEWHLLMPFVHWLPKTPMRRRYIRLWLALGRDPGFPRLRGASPAQKADEYYRYTRDQTFYRPYSAVGSAFVRRGFEVAFVSIDHPKLRRLGPLAALLTRPPLRGAFDRALLTFHSVEMLTTRPCGIPGEPGVCRVPSSAHG